jgi:hypothetical protein
VSGAPSTAVGLAAWTIEYAGEDFARFYRSLPEYEQAVLTAAIEHVLKVYGIEICTGEWGRPLGRGLYEFRVRRSLHAILSSAGGEPSALPGADRRVLLRVFCAFHGRVVVLHHGYDKNRDPSPKRQQKEIAKARRLHERWKRGGRR